MLPYLALLRMGFSVPPNVAAGAVGSYRGTAFAVPPPPAGATVSPFAVRGFPAWRFSLFHFPSPSPCGL